MRLPPVGQCCKVTLLRYSETWLSPLVGVKLDSLIRFIPNAMGLDLWIGRKKKGNSIGLLVLRTSSKCLYQCTVEVPGNGKIGINLVRKPVEF